MPKKMSTAKNASAAYQSLKAVQDCAKGHRDMVFASVQRARGNGYFVVRLENGEERRATPRGLFTRGNMRVDIGQIVVVSGDKSGMEIVGVVQERRQAMELVEEGKMAQVVLGSALSAGAVATAEVAASSEEEDYFEAPEDAGAEEEVVEEVNKHGVKKGRSIAESKMAVGKRLSALVSKVRPSKEVRLLPDGGVDIDAI